MFQEIKNIFSTVNQNNSSLEVQCIAPENCQSRHTTLCYSCKNNI